MKKSIKKLLFYSLSMGMSALLATACTDNEQTKNNASSSTTSTTNKDDPTSKHTNQPKDNTSPDTNRGAGDEKEIPQNQTMENHDTSANNKMGSGRAEDGNNPPNALTETEKGSESETEGTKTQDKKPPVADAQKAKVGESGKVDEQDHGSDADTMEGGHNHGTMGKSADVSPPPAPAAPPTGSQPMPSTEHSSESGDSKTVQK